MIEQDIVNKITSNGWTILQTTITGTESNLTHKAIAACKPSDGVMDRRWFKYYVQSDGTCYWQETDPFPVVVPVESFSSKVSGKIQSLITGGTIKAGYIERISEITSTALVIVIKADGTYATFHVFQKVDGTLDTSLITGTYPI